MKLLNNFVVWVHSIITVRQPPGTSLFDVNITKAVLYDIDGNEVTQKIFGPIHMSKGDSLDIKWTVDCDGPGLVTQGQHKTVDLNYAPSVVGEPPVIKDPDPKYTAAVQKWLERL